MFISLDKWKRQKKVENNALNLMSLNCKHKNWETELTVLLKSKHHFTSYLWNVKATENYIGKLIQFSKLGIRSEKIWKLDRQRVKTKFKGAVLLNVSNNLLFALMVKFIENNYSLWLDWIFQKFFKSGNILVTYILQTWFKNEEHFIESF